MNETNDIKEQEEIETKDVNVNEEKKLSFYQKNKDLLWEIFRFLLVGGIATLLDWAASIGSEMVLPDMVFGEFHLEKAIATTIGFTLGLIVNYVLSIIFVYKNKKDEKEGKSVKDFVIFTLVGVFVLLLSYLGIFLMSDLLKVPYFIARIIMTLIGLVINYLGRKILIFK